MSDENETVDIGGIAVPKQFKERWDELIGKNKELKNQLFEAKTTLQEAASAKNPELEKATKRIQELEGTLAKAEHSRVLAADGVDGDDDLYDYLQYKFGKVTAEEGKEKPGFVDWFKDAKTKDTGIQAALKAANASRSADTGAGAGDVEAPPKVKPQPPKMVPERKPGAGDSAMDAASIVNMDAATFTANRANIRKQMFGS